MCLAIKKFSMLLIIHAILFNIILIILIIFIYDFQLLGFKVLIILNKLLQ